MVIPRFATALNTMHYLELWGVLQYCDICTGFIWMKWILNFFDEVYIIKIAMLFSNSGHNVLYIMHLTNITSTKSSLYFVSHWQYCFLHSTSHVFHCVLDLITSSDAWLHRLHCAFVYPDCDPVLKNHLKRNFPHNIAIKQHWLPGHVGEAGRIIAHMITNHHLKWYLVLWWCCWCITSSVAQTFIEHSMQH